MENTLKRLRRIGRIKFGKIFLLAVLLLGTGLASELCAAVVSEEGERVYTSADVKITDAQRRAAEAFYRGKTIEWVSYTDPGASTEMMLRIMMKYLPKYIPGNPRMGSVQFMPGGGGLLSGNYLYFRAPRDGTMIGQLSNSIHRYPVFRKKVNYDLNEFTWIADYLPQNYRIVYTRRGIGLDTVEQLLKAPAIHVGVTEVGNPFYNYLRFGTYFLGIRFNIIPGYSDRAADLAIERGELDGKVEAALTFLTQRSHLLEQGKIVIHWQTEASRFSKLPNVPTILELAKKYANPQLGPKDLALLQTEWDLGRYNRYLAMPPGVPVERSLVVQEAVGKMIVDKEFYAEFYKLTGFEPDFTPGHVLQEAFRRLSDQPREIIDLLLKLFGPEPLPKR